LSNPAHTAPTNAPICPGCLGPLTRALGEKNGYTFLGCEKCGTAAVNPLPTTADLDAYYKAYYNTPKYMRKREGKLRQARKRLSRIPAKRAGETFLDVGCNYGYAVAAARDLGLVAHGIDIDPETVKAAQDTWGVEWFETARIEDYAAAGRKADILYTSEVIEHTPEPEAFAAAMARIVKPGGRLFLTTPAADHWAVPRKFTEWNEAKPPIHLILYSKEGLRRLLARHGFGEFRFEFKLKPRITLHAKRIG
jgi:SAM-dependent methyltransferase